MAVDDAQAGVSGPLKQVRAFGRDIPYYVIRFDKDGKCVSPESEDHLVAALQGGGYSHVLLYSHGWNNDFPSATLLYDRFLAGISDMAAAHAVLPADFAPLFVGIAWPSTALTFGAEGGPDIAGLPEDEKAELIEALEPDNREAAEHMLLQDAVPLEDARQLASWLAAAQPHDTDQEVIAGGPGADDLLAGWVAAGQPVAADSVVDGFNGFGTAPAATPGEQGPQAAAWPEMLDPRWIVRLGTVLIMKDRAGIVGANGVADLVGRLLRDTDAKLFLFGHSYGCKVVMTAMAAISAGNPRRQAEGVLLLQPAVSRLCFAADVGNGVEGGFVRALRLIARPVLATHSSRDFPLTQIFHLVARRELDAGELQMAGEPSRFAALGGFGASGCAAGISADVALPHVGSWPAPFEPSVRVVSLDGSDSIGGHGDVNRTETFWAALNLLK